MTLTEIGEARVRGYLFVFGRSLRSFLPAEVADDAVREVESHIRERLAQVADGGEEKTSVERVLAELGPPLRVAQAYSTEMTLDEAETTGRFVPMLRALWHMATTSLVGFAWALFVFTGWVIGISFLAVAVIKVVFPNNVGMFYVNGQFHSAGASFGLPPGTVVHPFGYWVAPVSLAVGLAALVGTQRASRAILRWLRSRQLSPRLRLRVEV
ncbi:MAG: HAAS signaling domain-containing protein, partial [Bacteroidales bacterium]